MTESVWDSLLHQFRERIAAATATPGGGTVAAVTAVFAAALLRMVCGISLRGASETGRENIEAMLDKVQHCEAALVRYADEDTRVFDAYMLARKENPDASQVLLLECARVPLAAAEAVEELQSLLPPIEAGLPAFLSSDLATAGHLLRASRESLLANVKINLDSLSDSANRQELQTWYERLTRSVRA